MKSKDIIGSAFNHDIKLKFESLANVNNPKSIHGLYPYRGKISSIEARSIISQLPNDATLLDPFCGSGTIVYEAQRLGMSAIGVDMNPLAISLTKAKTNVEQSEEEILRECDRLVLNSKIDLEKDSIQKMPDSALRSFHSETAKQIMSIMKYEANMSDYVRGAFFGAIALTARACNGYMWTSSTVGKNIEPKMYIDFFEKFSDKVRKHIYLNSGKPKASVILGDSRKLTSYIKDKSVDFVFTSPPYFDALDYTAYYGKLIYEMMSIDRQEIKKDLIQNVSSYEQDMIQVLLEIDRITTDDALIIFVVGDKKVKNGVINGGEFFSRIAPFQPTYIVERTYSGSSSQVFDTLNKTERKEQIVVWDKARRAK
ncbi:MAG: DNA adenine methylase [Sulfuricurvum sp.]|nr:DNA adenine methylase [Sulfuricurvum sp.]